MLQRSDHDGQIVHILDIDHVAAWFADAAYRRNAVMTRNTIETRQGHPPQHNATSSKTIFPAPAVPAVETKHQRHFPQKYPRGDLGRIWSPPALPGTFVPESVSHFFDT